MLSRRDRLLGGLFGALVGDALGVPYEFHAAASIPALAKIEMSPPEGFARAHRGVPPATWSDDGAQALCLLASLLEKGRLDPDDLARRLLAWLHEGYMAVDGKVFDVGIQTQTALRALKEGVSPLEAGPRDERNNGNGSLMRVLPLALWHRGTDAELVRDAFLQSRVTHGHARSRVCCALYCLWARRLLDERADPWGEAVVALRGTALTGEERDALEQHVRPDEPATGKGSGYVVDTLRSARMLAERGGTFEAAVKGAIALGDDTDTTACVVGGIVGVREGMEAIPVRWREALRGREIVGPLGEGLVGRG